MVVVFFTTTINLFLEWVIYMYTNEDLIVLESMNAAYNFAVEAAIIHKTKYIPQTTYGATAKDKYIHRNMHEMDQRDHTGAYRKDGYEREEKKRMANVRKWNDMEEYERVGKNPHREISDRHKASVKNDPRKRRLLNERQEKQRAQLEREYDEHGSHK